MLGNKQFASNKVIEVTFKSWKLENLCYFCYHLIFKTSLVHRTRERLNTRSIIKKKVLLCNIFSHAEQLLFKFKRKRINKKTSHTLKQIFCKEIIKGLVQKLKQAYTYTFLLALRNKTKMLSVNEKISWVNTDNTILSCTLPHTCFSASFTFFSESSRRMSIENTSNVQRDNDNNDDKKAKEIDGEVWCFWHTKTIQFYVSKQKCRQKFKCMKS